MRQELRGISQLNLKLLEPLTVHETYRTVIEYMKTVLPIERGMIYLYENGQFTPVHRTFPEKKPVLPRKDGYSMRVIKTGKPIAVDVKDILSERPELKRRIKTSKSSAYIPLSYKKHTFGVMVLISGWTRAKVVRKMDLLLAYSSVISLAIRKAQAQRGMEDALRIRDVFISVANHELKTPLTTILMCAQLIARDASRKKLPDAKIVERLISEAKRQRDLLNEMLVVDRIRRGEMEFAMKDAELSEIVSNAVQLFVMRTPTHTVSLDLDALKGHAPVRADTNKLIQTLSNILNNAARYSPKGSHIAVILSADGTSFSVTVKDQGRGIPKDDLSNIYDLFYRGRNARENGMGIGLFIAKQTVDAHKGFITVQSEPGKGTAFTITIPAATTRL